MSYHRDLETSKEKMDSHNESQRSAARARMDKVAEQKRKKRQENKERKA